MPRVGRKKDRYRSKVWAEAGKTSLELTRFRNTWAVGVRGVASYFETRAFGRYWSVGIKIQSVPNSVVEDR